MSEVIGPDGVLLFGNSDHQWGRLGNWEGNSMTHALLMLLITVLIVGVIVSFVYWAIDAVPIAAPFNRLAKMLTILIGVLIIIFKAMPLIEAVM